MCSLVLSVSLWVSSCAKKHPKKLSETHTDTGRWEVDRMKQDLEGNVEIPSAQYIIDFSVDSIFQIHLDVNSCSGSYKKYPDGRMIIENNLVCTRACCDSDYATRLVRVLGQTLSYRHEGEKLVLIGEGEVVLKPIFSQEKPKK